MRAALSKRRGSRPDIQIYGKVKSSSEREDMRRAARRFAFELYGFIDMGFYYPVIICSKYLINLTFMRFLTEKRKMLFFEPIFYKILYTCYLHKGKRYFLHIFTLYFSFLT
jgi:hypothetical protein